MHPLTLVALVLLVACAAEPPPAEFVAPPVPAPSTQADPDAAEPERAVAFTVDDLPLQGGGGTAGLACDPTALLAMHDRLLAGLAAHGIAATGFVNEGQACGDLTTLEAVLTRWLDAGHGLGNHTYSHPDLTATTVEAYAADVVRGEALTRRLLEARGQRLRFFRHPFLRTGETEAKKEALAAFLDERGYTVAPVTIDSDEWVFAAAYARALGAGDTVMVRRIRETYLTWFDGVFAHYEGWSREVLGYEPPQVLLLHANLLNADTAADLAALLARRGYRSVSLDAALEDPAYRRPDPSVGRYGSSWLHRWARGQGMAPRWEPDAPGWVTAYYEAGR